MVGVAPPTVTVVVAFLDDPPSQHTPVPTLVSALVEQFCWLFSGARGQPLRTCLPGVRPTLRRVQPTAVRVARTQPLRPGLNSEHAQRTG